MNNSTFGPVNISLDPATLTALTNGGYKLYVSCAVKFDNAAARPTIWHAEESLTASISLALADEVEAYISNSRIDLGAPIDVGNQTAIEAGQTWIVSASGLGPVKTAGPADRMTVENTSGTAFISGLSRTLNGSKNFTPIFAAPLYGHQSNGAIPVPELVLQFSSNRWKAGSVMDIATSQAQVKASHGPYLSVQLATAETTRQVTYEINAGWSWGGYTWAKVLPGSAVMNVLIQSESG